MLVPLGSFLSFPHSFGKHERAQEWRRDLQDICRLGPRLWVFVLGTNAVQRCKRIGWRKTRTSRSSRSLPLASTYPSSKRHKSILTYCFKSEKIIGPKAPTFARRFEEALRFGGCSLWRGCLTTPSNSLHCNSPTDTTSRSET
jgi:hypothetical protein